MKIPLVFIPVGVSSRSGVVGHFPARLGGRLGGGPGALAAGVGSIIPIPLSVVRPLAVRVPPPFGVVVPAHAGLGEAGAAGQVDLAVIILAGMEEGAP